MPSAPALVLLAALAPIVACDLRHRTIPDAVTAPAALAAAALAPGHLGAAALVGVPLAALALAAPEHLGMGDAKLAALLGLGLGEGVLVALPAGLAAAAAVGVAARLRTVPLAPFLAVGAVLALATTP